MAAADKPLKEGKLHIKQNKFGKKWKRCYVFLYPDSPFGVARLEIYDWKDGTLAGEKFHTRKAADRKVIRLVEFIHVAPTQTESGHKDNMAAFTIETSEKTMLLSAERTVCEDWVQTLSEAAFPGRGNDGKPVNENSESKNLEMSINSIYFSRDQVSEFRVTVQRTEAAERCSLRGSYILGAEADCLILKDAETKEILYSWPYKLLRRYGRDKVMFSFEAGRRCASGPGNFTFETSQGHEIFQKVEFSIRAQQGSEKRLSGPCVDTEAATDFMCQDSEQSEISGLTLKKDAEEKALRGRVLPNLPTTKAAQPPYLLEPSLPGKSSTPPRSPLPPHHSDSDHLTVYSEPRDSVRGATPHFDPLYSDPVDSVSHKVKAASPLYSDLYEQVAYEVVGGGASAKTPNTSAAGEEHIYDEPEGIVCPADPPKLYSEVRMEAAAWRRHANDEKLGYEYPHNPNTNEYSLPNAPRSQPRSRVGPKPVPAPKPQGVLLGKPPGKERDPEKVQCPNTTHPNRNNNNNANIEALYSQVIKPGYPKSAKPQPAPPLPATHQLQSAPPLPHTHQLQSAPPLPHTHQLQSAPPLPHTHQSQSAPSLPHAHQSQSAPPLPHTHQSQSAPPLPHTHQSQSAPPLPHTHQSQSAPPLPHAHQSQSAPPTNKPLFVQAPPPPAKPHSASTQPMSVKTLPLPVPETTKTLPAQPHPSNGNDMETVPVKDTAVIYEDMGYL